MNQKTYYDFFKELSKIPRASGNEVHCQKFLLSFAEELGLEAFQEADSGNIIIKKPATEGYEHIAPVILQGHMDMVAEKTPESTHCFDTDPIELIEEKGILRANGTTLGADNGIGVAYSMAILAAKDIQHPALEAIFTTEEETSMKGAEHLHEDTLKGKYMLNLDSEEEGVFCVSSAGGLDFVGTLHLTKTTSLFDKSFEIILSGLTGGHSGMNIAAGRGNANKIAGRLLRLLTASFPHLEIATFKGGSKPNAIPRDASFTINLPEDEKNLLQSILHQFEETITHELSPVDKLCVSLAETELEANVFSKENRDSLIDFLNLIPNGVNTMSKTIHGLVESSQNLGVVATQEGSVHFRVAVRSSVDSLATYLGEQNLTLAKLCSIDGQVSNGYPGWEYNPNSPLRELAIKTYFESTGKEAKIEAIHAGLECGFFAGKMKDLDIISFGPNLYDVHSPSEHMDIGSADRVYNYLVLLLKEMKHLSR